MYPRVFVEFRRISREITDGQRSRCLAILRTDHPAFRPVEISARSIAVSILRTTRNPSPAQHCCYDAMTPQSVFGKKRAKNGKRPGPPVHDDLVQRDFTADDVNELWLTDIERHEALLNRAVVKGHRLRSVAADRVKLRAA